MTKNYSIKSIAAMTVAALAVVVGGYMAVSAASATASPLFRLYNPNSGDHFYTTSTAQRDSAKATGYTDEGVEGYVSPTSITGTAPLYRLYNPATGRHFYTTLTSDRDKAVAGGFRNENTEGYVPTASTTGTTALYRLYSPTSLDHFYTDSAATRAAAERAGYVFEGVEGFAFSSPDATISASGAQTPLYRLYQPANNDHFYTSSAADVTAARDGGYRNEGVEGSVSTTSAAGFNELTRLYNPSTGHHFYTTYTADHAAAIAAGYRVEPSVGYVQAAAASGDTPLYRLYNPSTGDHFYTLSAAERDAASGAGYTVEGTEGFVYGTDAPAPSPSVTPSPSVSPSPTPSATPTPSPTPTPTPTPGVNLIANPSVEDSTGGVPTGWMNAVDTTQTKATFNYLASGHTGAHSLETTVTAIGGTYPGAQWAPSTPSPVSPGATYKYTEYYKSTADSEVDVEYTNTAGVTSFLQVVSPALANASWTQLSGSFSVPADAKTVTVYHVLAVPGTVTTDDFSLAPYTPTGFSRGLVSFSFDDAWKNVRTNGLPILQKYKVHSTQYLLTGPTQANDPDYMSLQDMLDFYKAGDEIAAHTITHPDLTTLTAAQVDNELSGSRDWLRANVDPTVNNFATPYGKYNTSVLTEIAKYFTYHRSTDEGYNSKDSFNPLNIKVQNILSSTTTAQVAAWIDQANRDHTWLVLVYHQVTPTAPTTTDTDPATGKAIPDVYWTTPADLDTELGYATSLKASVGTESIKEALGEITPQLAK